MNVENIRESAQRIKDLIAAGARPAITSEIHKYATAIIEETRGQTVTPAATPTPKAPKRQIDVEPKPAREDSDG
jgi:hypothetical protein